MFYSKPIFNLPNTLSLHSSISCLYLQTPNSSTPNLKLAKIILQLSLLNYFTQAISESFTRRHQQNSLWVPHYKIPLPIPLNGKNLLSHIWWSFSDCPGRLYLFGISSRLWTPERRVKYSLQTESPTLVYVPFEWNCNLPWKWRVKKTRQLILSYFEMEKKIWIRF